MKSKKWKIQHISNGSIPFDSLFNSRNKYHMSKEEFFNPTLDYEFDASIMLGMKKSVDKIYEHMQKKQKICIYGDYDVDGTSAVAILLKTFNLLEYKNVMFYVPNRKDEGYGLNTSAIDNLLNQHVSLIITVDCGITAINETDYANSVGIEVIITDHHQVGDITPNAYAIINPHQKKCKYPYKNLCGAGVAYKLAKELLKVQGKTITDEILEIAGVATVADIMEINGENRVIVKNALKSIQQNCYNLGIKALIEEAGIDKQNITTYTIGFGIAPRINSAGRIDDASLSVRLFMSKNPIEAKTYASKLNYLNYQRQEMVKDIYEMSLVQAENQKDNNVIVTYSNGWDVGVIGIVSSRLVDVFSKPSIVIGISDGIGHASCRSIGDFNIFEALSSMNDMFEKFGGHDMAAGFSIKEEKIEDFIEKINNYVQEKQVYNFDVCLDIDSIIQDYSVTLENYEELSNFEPFGISNKKPIFLLTDVNLENPQFIGKDNNHFKARTKKSNINLVQFNAYDNLKDCNFDRKLDIAFTMNKNFYNDITSIQMILEDIRYSYDYEKEYETLYNIITDNVSYFKSNYKFKNTNIDFKKLDFYNITNLDGNNLFLCYSYQSYYYLRKLFYYDNIQLDIYQDYGVNICKNTVMFFPLLEKSNLDDYNHIILCDDINSIEKIIYACKCEKYVLDFDKFDIKIKPYDIRQNMVLVYNFYNKYNSKNTSITDIINFLRIDPFIFFITNIILKNTNLIDINYDFKYNKIYTKIKKTEEKQKLIDNIIYNKFEEYFKIFENKEL